MSLTIDQEIDNSKKQQIDPVVQKYINDLKKRIIHLFIQTLSIFSKIIVLIIKIYF